ncbi:sensor histidine kinase [Sphingobacterium sp. HMA12]|jgi:hypothetical protein|uniref:sensor histidine kinase n=1 Tax=Sphingobacterium sp. HMA12 TaxID=2050894 RepID=UPI000CEA3151|nr:ATP-binding protein [Sphingobacterium sp. HMA12]
MKKLLFHLIYAMLSLHLVYSQGTGAIDSLRNEFMAAKSDTAKLSLSNKLTREYFVRGDSISAFQYGYRSLALSKKTKIPLYQAKGRQIMGYLHTLKLSDPSGDKTLKVQNANEQLGIAIGELRRTARGMMPENLLKNGLATAVHDLCADSISSEVQIEFQSNSLFTDLCPNNTVHIYRIVQELLTNAIKHGEAKNILVQLIQEKDSILITVDDDGKGFDPTKLANATGIGLKNIQNRVNFLKGKLSIDSTTEHGTSSKYRDLCAAQTWH